MTCSGSCVECANPNSQLPYITRTEAKKRGLKFYYTGNHCHKNHKSPRYVNNRGCVLCQHLRNVEVKENTKLEVISCDEAKAKGLTFFFTGRPCIHGHIKPRYVCNSECIECIKNRQSKEEIKRKQNCLADKLIIAPKVYIYRWENWVSGDVKPKVTRRRVRRPTTEYKGPVQDEKFIF